MQEGQLVAGRYKILGTIGEGGMANVYLAKDLILDRQVAVKALRLDLRGDESIQKRFKREAIATSELSHPNIVNVLDVGEDDNGMQYMVIEYINGSNLKTFIKDNFPIPYQQIIDMMKQILSAVQVAHEHDIIHRDLKPENILVDKHGIVKVSDFGIALALSERSLTQTNSALGSVHYMSPEQSRGKTATVQSDIYSLGIILYEMLTNRVPFTGDSAVSVAFKHFREPMPSAREIDPRIPQALENVIFRATAKEPEQRYNSVKEMGEDLKTTLLSTRANEEKLMPIVSEDMLEETKIMSPIDGVENLPNDIDNDKKPKKKMSKKKKRILILSVLALVLLLIFSGVWAANQKQISVPDVSNFTEEQANDLLTSRKLKIGKVYKVYNDDISAGHIVKTIPEVGARVKRDSEINLELSLGAKKYKMPNLVGRSYNSISDKIKKRGFTIHKKAVYSNSVTKGNIMSQSIKPGSKVSPKNKILTLKVSKGENLKKKLVTIKDLSGYNLTSVRDYANEYGLDLNVIQEYSDDVDKGQVIRQDPIAGTQVLRGSQLTIYISQGKKEKLSTFSKTITIPYLASKTTDDKSSSDDKDDSDDSKDSDDTDKTTTTVNSPNNIKIYVTDEKNSDTDVYRELNITEDTPITISFTVLNNGSASYRVVRDGVEIMNQTVNG